MVLKSSRKLLIIISIWVIVYHSLVFASSSSLVIPKSMMLPIGIKIWFNESGGKISGLTVWNQGEEFASLGIGHFIWYPYPGRRNFHGGFEYLMRYMKSQGVPIPAWLDELGFKCCPWANREAFLAAQNSPRMVELRNFLQKTIPIQAQYIAQHLEQSFPEMLDAVPKDERPYIYDQFYKLSQNPMGVYAMVDYLNFKGPGISNSLRHYHHGSGLLQVLEGMQFAPQGMDTIEAFAWSAKQALAERVRSSSPSLHEERWLAGWFKRVDTYVLASDMNG